MTECNRAFAAKQAQRPRRRRLRMRSAPKSGMLFLLPGIGTIRAKSQAARLYLIEFAGVIRIIAILIALLGPRPKGARSRGPDALSNNLHSDRIACHNAQATHKSCPLLRTSLHSVAAFGRLIEDFDEPCIYLLPFLELKLHEGLGRSSNTQHGLNAHHARGSLSVPLGPSMKDATTTGGVPLASVPVALPFPL